MLTRENMYYFLLIFVRFVMTIDALEESYGVRFGIFGYLLPFFQHHFFSELFSVPSINGRLIDSVEHFCTVSSVFDVKLIADFKLLER